MGDSSHRRHPRPPAYARAAPDLRVWQLYLDAEPPLGYDPATLPPWKDGPLGGAFAALRLDPWRVTVLTAEAAAAGRFYDAIWTSAG